MNERDVTDSFPLLHHQQAFPSLLEDAALLINIQHVINAEGGFNPFGSVIQFVEVSDLVRQTDVPDATSVTPIVVNRFGNLSSLQY